jgi:hypothetical protein
MLVDIYIFVAILALGVHIAIYLLIEWVQAYNLVKGYEWLIALLLGKS